jgi:hypothetical protein
MIRDLFCLGSSTEVIILHQHMLGIRNGGAIRLVFGIHRSC